MKTKNILVILLIFLSIGALVGGGSFILMPEGWGGMTPENMLSQSPFHNFMIPGIILFTVLGIMPGFVVWGLIKRKNCSIAEAVNIFPDMHWSWSWSVYSGFALLIWIYMEVYFLKEIHWLHSFYFFFGILILLVALLKPIREYYKSSK